MDNFDFKILVGTPFMESNDIAVKLALCAIIIRDTLYQYRSSETKPLHKTVRRAVVLWAPLTSTTIWRGEFLEEALPDDVPADNEPRTDTRSARSTKISLLWPPPGIVSSFAGKIGIPNLSKYWNATDNFVKSTTPSVQQTLFNNQGLLFIPLKDNNKRKKNTLVPAQLASIMKNHLRVDVSVKFRATLNQFDYVFNPKVEYGNGAAGPFEAEVNMHSV